MRGRGSPAWITFVSMPPRFPFIFEISKVYTGFVQYSNIDLLYGRSLIRSLSEGIRLLCSSVTMRPYHSFSSGLHLKGLSQDGPPPDHSHRGQTYRNRGDQRPDCRAARNPRRSAQAGGIGSGEE